MAKNRDRRKDPKPKPPKGEPPPLRKARPDLLLRVFEKFRLWNWSLPGLTAMEVAKEMSEHVDDVSDCFVALVRQGTVERHDDRFFPAAKKPDPPEKREILDPPILLKIRRVFERVGTASASDFKSVKDIDRHLDQLKQDGLVVSFNGGELWRLRMPPKNPSFSHWRVPIRQWNATCPWCGRPTRRHSRADVHDPEQCRSDMIASIMGE